MKEQSNKTPKPPAPRQGSIECPPPTRPSYTVRQLQGLLEISNLVGSVMEIDDILREIVRQTADMFSAPVCSIYLFGPDKEYLTLRANTGLGEESEKWVGTLKLPVGRGLIGLAAENNETIAVPDAAADPRHETFLPDETDAHHANICVPLRIQEDVIGVMTARRYKCEFTAQDCTIFETIAKQVAIVIEKSRMHFEKLQADRLAGISISLSEVAHYIKNLLTSTKGGIYFVDSGLKRGDLEMARKGWDVLKRGNRRIASLVENMLNYSREVALQFKPADINAIVYEILEQIDDTAVERGVALLPEMQRDVPRLQLDYEKMHDALLNLIVNAIEAIPAGRVGGLVLVRSRLSEDGNHLEVSIRDNGTGMTEEVRQKLFNLFFSTKGDKGSGIGLAVTRKIIEQHHGTIEVETQEGVGTTFRVRLPVHFSGNVAE